MSPSRDPINQAANAWLHGAESEDRDREKRIRSSRRKMSAMILRLAGRLGVDPDFLAERIPEDTIRRTKFPAIEIVNEDGTRSFRHDIDAGDGRRALS